MDHSRVALFKKLRNIFYMSNQNPEVNEIKVIGRIRPGILHIVNNKLRIRCNPERLYRT
jgi:hypothetical protein